MFVSKEEEVSQTELDLIMSYERLKISVKGLLPSGSASKLANSY